MATAGHMHTGPASSRGRAAPGDAQCAHCNTNAFWEGAIYQCGHLGPRGGGGRVARIYAIRQSLSEALVAHYQEHVDEASKKELKDVLTQDDQTLLVADLRHCECKTLGRSWWLCSLPDAPIWVHLYNKQWSLKKIKAAASSDSGENLSSPTKASLASGHPCVNTKRRKCKMAPFPPSSQTPLHSAQPAQLHPAASPTTQTPTTWLDTEGLLLGPSE